MVAQPDEAGIPQALAVGVSNALRQDAHMIALALGRQPTLELRLLLPGQRLHRGRLVVGPTVSILAPSTESTYRRAS